MSKGEFHAVIRFEGPIRAKKDDGWCTGVVRFEECEDWMALNEERRAVSRHQGALMTKQKSMWKAPSGVRFSGVLQSHAPYMWHKGKFYFSNHPKYGRQLQPARRCKVLAVRPDRISVAHCIWMLEHEISAADARTAGAAIDSAIQGGKLTPYRDRAKYTDRYVLAEEFRSWLQSEELENSFFYRKLFSTTEFHRMKFQPQIITVFGVADDVDRVEAIRALHPDQLEACHATLSTTPWMMCFRRFCGSKYKGLGELSYAGLKRALQAYRLEEPDRHIMAAVRFYHGTLIPFNNRLKDTMLPLRAMRLKHVDRSRLGNKYEEGDAVIALLKDPATRQDGQHLFEAIKWMLSPEVGALVEVQEGHVMLRRQHYWSKRIVGFLGMVYRQQKLPALRPGNLVPCVYRQLDDEQQEACMRLLRGDPLVMVSGGPGYGKTEIILWVVATFMKSLVVTRDGMMVKELRKRLAGALQVVDEENQSFRPEAAHTIDSVHMKTLVNPAGRAWASQFEVLVIDEASNVDLHHMYMALQATSPSEHGDGVKQILLVFDHNQQRPIGIGEPVMALRQVLPERFMELKTQHRVHESALAIDRAAKMMLAEQSRSIPYARVVSAGAQMVQTLRSEESVINIDPGVGSLMRWDGPVLGRVITKMMEVAGGEEWWTRWQMIAFKNSDVKLLSEAVFKWLVSRGKIDEEALRVVPGTAGGLRLGPGVKIIFRDTFRGVYDEDKKKYLWPEVRNGEICIIRAISENGKVLTLMDGREVCLNKTVHVNPYKVLYGYCVTSYAAQGCGFRAVCTYVHPQSTRGRAWPARDSYYTAHTRASRLSISFGRLEDIHLISSRVPRERLSGLRVLLERSDLKNAQFRHNRRGTLTLRDPRNLRVAPLRYKCAPTTADIRANKPYSWPTTLTSGDVVVLEQRAAGVSRSEMRRLGTLADVEAMSPELAAFCQLSAEGDDEDEEEEEEIPPEIEGEFADFIVPDEEDGEEEEDDEWIQGDQHGSWIPRAARDGPPPELPALRGRPRRSCRNAE